jgi:hypothetical protein
MSCEPLDEALPDGPRRSEDPDRDLPLGKRKTENGKRGTARV